MRFMFTATLEAESWDEANEKMRALWAGQEPSGIWLDTSVFADSTPELVLDWGRSVAWRVNRRLFSKTRKVA